ncbi:hypothetical protein PENSPDRAFT_62895 [Peniophora sp. CONT]|nr:hypothetical protein PENSPDRAFT_62895 [Peniophora sp. CONT]
MVVSATHHDLYLSHRLLREDGMHSSSESSDIHSPGAYDAHSLQQQQYNAQGQQHAQSHLASEGGSTSYAPMHRRPLYNDSRLSTMERYPPLDATEALRPHSGHRSSHSSMGSTHYDSPPYYYSDTPASTSGLQQSHPADLYDYAHGQPSLHPSQNQPPSLSSLSSNAGNFDFSSSMRYPSLLPPPSGVQSRHRPYGAQQPSSALPPMPPPLAAVGPDSPPQLRSVSLGKQQGSSPLGGDDSRGSDPISPTSPVSPTRASGSGSQRTTGRGSRKEISNIVIACRQCRARKIKCDSTRPECNNCLRRNNPCEYDAQPKRRGPDKRPGTRQRSCRKRMPTAPDANDTDAASAVPPPPKKRRRTESEVKTKVEESEQELDLSAPQLSLPLPSLSLPPSYRPSSNDIYLGRRPQHPQLAPQAPMDTTNPAFATFIDSSQNARPIIPLTTHEVWWLELLDSYDSKPELAIEAIASDLNTLVRSSSYWLTFLDPSAVLRNPHRPLVLSACALATLVMSSESERGQGGRDKAILLRDQAQSALEAARDARQIDLQLAEAAMCLALFETSAHPLHLPYRAEQALQTLDTLLAALRLPALDAAHPDRSLRTETGIPIVARPPGYSYPQTCSCTPKTEAALDIDGFPAEAPCGPPHDDNDEARRLVWVALMLATHHSVGCALSDREPLELRLFEVERFQLLLPAERVAGADNVASLYCRAMLLWNSTMVLRTAGPEIVQRAVIMMQETHELEDLLDAHQCDGKHALLLYMAKELVANIRLATTMFTRRITADVTPVQPALDSQLAEDWLYYQEQVAARVAASLPQAGNSPGHLFRRRPFLTQWFLAHATTCMDLWQRDAFLLRALELAKTLVAALDVLNTLWPCVEFKHQASSLRARLVDACRHSGVMPPSPQPPELSTQIAGL